MKVEVLYFQGCPNHRPAVERVRHVLAAEGISADILQVEVTDAETSLALNFAGSPSVRVNGVDVEGCEPGTVGLSCRTYMNGAVREGAPSLESIRRAVRSATGEPHENQ